MSCLSGLVPKNIEAWNNQKIHRKSRSNEEHELARDLNHSYEFIGNGDSCTMEDFGLSNPWYSPIAMNGKIPQASTSLLADVHMKSLFQPTPSKRKPKRKVRIVDKDSDVIFRVNENSDPNREIDEKYSVDSHDALSTNKIPNTLEGAGRQTDNYICKRVDNSGKMINSANSPEKLHLEMTELKEKLKKERDSRFYNLRVSLRSVSQKQFEERNLESIHEAHMMKDCKLCFVKTARLCAENMLSRLSSPTKITSPLQTYYGQVERVLRKYKVQLNREIQHQVDENIETCTRHIMDEFGCMHSVVRNMDDDKERMNRDVIKSENDVKNLVQLEKFNALCEYVLNGFSFEGVESLGNENIQGCIEIQKGIEEYFQMRASSGLS